jgi:hypothetical protein
MLSLRVSAGAPPTASDSIAESGQGQVELGSPEGAGIGQGTASSQPAAEAATATGESSAEQPDSQALIAAGPPSDLAAAVAEHLLTVTESHHPPAFFRAQALSALASLLGQLAPEMNNSLAGRLLAVAENPGLNEYDQLELSSQDPLSRGRLDLGARSLGPLALVTAATAAALAADAGVEAESLWGQPTQYMVTQAAQLLHDQDREAAKNGAIVLAMGSRYEPDLARYADALVVHPSAQVRGVAASTAVLDESAQRILAADSSPQVRAMLASRGTGARRRRPRCPPGRRTSRSETCPRHQRALRRW